MIGTAVIEHAVRLAIYTPAVRGETPVSMLLLAPPEHGKSEILKKFAFVPSVRIVSEFNTFTFSEIANEFTAGRIKTLILPDFLRVVKRKYSTAANAISILNAITAEGWIGRLPLGQMIDRPIILNVITALTEGELRDKRHKWAQLGFLSRFVPLSYSYSRTTKDRIRNYIKDRIYVKDNVFNFEIPKSPVDIILPPEEGEALKSISIHLSEQNNLTGFRLQRQLQTLAMANALVSGRTVVNEEDVKIIQKIAELINFDFNPL